MEKYISNFNEYFSKKNLIIGAVLLSVLSLMGYKLYDKGYLNNIIDNNNNSNNDNNDNDNDDNKPKITSKDIDRYIQKEFSKVLKSFAIEAQNTAKKMSEFNRDFLLKSDYLNFRNQLFTKDIEKHLVLIDSKNVKHTDSHDTSKYTINFDGSNNDNNNTSGYGRLKNVIGFRLIKATIPSKPFHITENNKNVYIYFNSNYYTFTLTEGNYTNDTLATELQTQLNNGSSWVKESDGLTPLSHSSGFTVTFNDTTLKYTITHTSISFFFNFIESKRNSAHNILGFKNLETRDVSSAITTIISEYLPDMSLHFVDLVVPEIPYNACKKNSLGKNVIDRIPITDGPGSIVDYTVPFTEYFTQNYFYPLSLSKITIELYEDQNDKEYNTGNLNNYFEFEITTIKKTDKFNLPHE